MGGTKTMACLKAKAMVKRYRGEGEENWGLSGRTEEGRIHGLVSQPWEGVKLLYS